MSGKIKVRRYMYTMDDASMISSDIVIAHHPAATLNYIPLVRLATVPSVILPRTVCGEIRRLLQQWVCILYILCCFRHLRKKAKNMIFCSVASGPPLSFLNTVFSSKRKLRRRHFHFHLDWYFGYVVPLIVNLTSTH